MLIHCVFCNVDPAADPADWDAAMADLASLPAEVPGMVVARLKRRAITQRAGRELADHRQRHPGLPEAIKTTALRDAVADVLPGTTMAVLRRQLEAHGVPQRDVVVTLADLPRIQGAVVMNSWTPGVAVTGIGGTRLPEAPDFLALLHNAFAAEPAVPLAG